MKTHFVILFIAFVASFGTSSCDLQHSRKKEAVKRLSELYKHFVKDSRNTNVRIVHGNNADKNEYPWQARILFDDYFICGGVVLNERTILTAAHCITYSCHESISIAHLYKVIVGTHTIRRPISTVQTATVETIIVHHNYDANEPLKGNDLAILHLTSPLKLSPAVQPVRLSDSNFDKDALTNTKCYLSGWGRMMDGDSYKLPKDLQEVNANIITNDECRSLVSSVKITKRHVCTTYKGLASSCSGDSGGPMGCYDNDGNFRLIGIDSFGKIVCGVTAGSTGYMRVSKYRRWISKNALGRISI